MKTKFVLNRNGFKDVIHRADCRTLAGAKFQPGSYFNGQAQRGRDKQLAARLREREKNRRRDRNHKLSRRLVSENALIVVSKDNLRGLARNHFGKSVGDAGHGELRRMLSDKCTASGRSFIEVSPKNSTRLCSSCRGLHGPTGWSGLSVRHWECTACGASHDRDINAALNTLNAGLGSSLELAGDGISETRFSGDQLPVQEDTA